MSKAALFRMVMRAWWVINAAISRATSSPESSSRAAEYADRKRWVL
jgi:hypothetical protein